MEELLARAKEKYSEQDYKLISDAYDFASRAHKDQHRASGEPYIVHPSSVALILIDLNMDAATIAAALLHDTVEDTSCENSDIERQFGREVANLVDGVTKLSRINFSSKEEQQAESLRKMFIATASDVRVMLLKLADRLHNMRTLSSLPHEKQIYIANETLSIYAPVANRLGIYQIKWELEDISLRYLDPEAYNSIHDSINQKRAEREAYIASVIDIVKPKLDEAGIDAYIYGRPKHFYSIYKKMKAHNVGIDQIYDLTALRVIVSSVKDCYGVLGIVHTIFKPMPGRFKDYIAMPKVNMYQSLHTTVIGPNGTPFEIQIRTKEMHETAEYGIAAHWKYKEGVKGSSDSDVKLAWLRKMLDYDTESRDSREFVDSVKSDFFSDEVFVFTPRGDVIDLPAGATPLDFAYSIHSAIGHKCIGAKINGRIVNLDAQLKTGDIVEIMTSAAPHGPSRDWLNIVKTNEAKSKIRQWFKKELREENIVKGRDMMEKEAKRQGYSLPSLLKNEWLEPIMSRYMLQSIDDLYASVGYGGLTTNQVLFRLIEEYRKANHLAKPEDTLKPKAHSILKSSSDVIVKGQADMLVRFAHCCNPVPGDDIVGYITRGRGVSIHRRDCNNLSDFEPEREIEVSWATEGNISYTADVQLLAYDRRGIVIDISNMVYANDLKLISINAQGKNGVATVTFSIEIKNTEQLDSLIRQMKKINGVIEVYRVNK
ncbi:MAG: bifunctional (p)ppGpp synthetase/guanosine-3',5'-bis(diphosphate) 3'-pyrophosphohydrolase [Firmicutes bacterium]|nr:bifunctional (p)ppGpp synthetase/guanosine-3',5'-bis(diphosphate) 3'-pyrophosphohydrolase [Bacillota bacterium]